MEPEYTFKKGEGWVVTIEPEHETITEIIGRCRVTLIKRPPLPSEKYAWSENISLGQTMSNLKGRMWLEYFESGDFTTFNLRAINWGKRSDRTMLVEVL